VNVARLVLIGWLAGTALGAPGDGAVRDGNALYRAGDYEDAIQAYENAGDESALALFNRACALQRLGRDEEARELLQRVDAMTRRNDLAASARYNLGAASTQQARALAGEGQAPEALDAYRRASRLFRDAYAMNPGDRDAARNIEVVGREAKALIEQMRAQQQAMQEMADQLENLQQQQQQESEQNQQQSSSQQQQQQQAAQRQQDLNQQTQAAHDQLQQMQEQMQQQLGQQNQPEQDPLERASQKMQDAMRQQQRAQEQLEEGEQQDAAESQREAAEALRDALREMMGEQESQKDPQQQKSDEPNEQEPSDSGENAESEHAPEPPDQQQQSQPSESQQGQGQAEQPSQQDAGSGEAGDENADPLDMLAEDLLEKEKEDRDRLQRIRAARRAKSTPVEKDW